MSIKILIADDHKIIRDGLQALISGEADMEVVAKTDSGYEAVEFAKRYSPDIVIMDINIPDLNGIDATRLILSENPGVKVIALSVHSASRFVKEILKAGASGYLVKHCAFEELAAAIRTVSQNKRYLSSEIISVVMDEYIAESSSEKPSVFMSLTSREREILQLVVLGLKSAEIAARFCISVKTVSTHRRQIMKKLNLSSVAELTRYSIREGLISQED
jgi:DNA-binding NarL/FixJ family response regulator